MQENPLQPEKKHDPLKPEDSLSHDWFDSTRKSPTTSAQQFTMAMATSQDPTDCHQVPDMFGRHSRHLQLRVFSPGFGGLLVEMLGSGRRELEYFWVEDLKKDSGSSPPLSKDKI